ncbi:hypothetical protein NKH77_38265 [Streptomyces sp. M19]
MPLAGAPALERLSLGSYVPSLDGVPRWLRVDLPDRLPSETDRAVEVLRRLVSQPVGQAMVLSIVALVCAYAVTGMRGRARQ